jgi:hypothetical protein
MQHRLMRAGGLRRVTLASAFSLASSAAGAADPDNFRVRTTEDLVQLCSVEPADPNYVAAIHFCHGFGSGAYQYYESTVAPNERFCVPAKSTADSQ